MADATAEPEIVHGGEELDRLLLAHHLSFLGFLDAQVPEPELRDAICACVHELLPGLKPEYADVVRAVDLEERALAEVAAERAVTVNNATVRLQRARQALRKQLLRACGACAAHGCLECHCRKAPGPRTPG